MGLTDTAIERLRALIVNGDLSPGARLPPEQQLVEDSRLDCLIR